jgi:hypothetical protein
LAAFTQFFQCKIFIKMRENIERVKMRLEQTKCN